MEAEQARILIVDDDRELRELIAETLSEYGYYSQAAKNGAELFAALEREPFDLILLDIMMPGEDGLSLCRRLRAPGTSCEHIPVIFLTALGGVTDRVVGLELGGDDYLPKPFEMRELVARMRALLRRAAVPRQEARHSLQSPVWRFGQWRVNIGARHLIDEHDVVVSLSSVEFKLLMLFLEHPQFLLTREAILEHMAERSDVYDRSIDVQVSRLRAKLQDNGRNPALIRTMRGDGYMLAVPVEKGGV